MKQFSLIAVLILNSVVLAQTSNPLAKVPALRSHELMIGISQGNVQSILEAGNSGDQSLIPALRKQLKNRKDGGAAYAAMLALAKLGEPKELQELFCRIEKGAYLRLDKRLKEDIPYVGGWYAIQILNGVAEGRFAQHPDLSSLPDDLVYVSPLRDALKAISQILPDVPRTKVPNTDFTEVSIETWRNYLAKNEQSLRTLKPTGKGVNFSPASCGRRWRGR